MHNVYIFHGWGADSTSNWFPWLAKELGKKQYSVTVPNFPNTLNPKLNEWLDYFSQKRLDNSILVGHSLGAPFILRLLEQYSKNNLEHMSGGETLRPVRNNQIEAAFLVSAFDRSLGIPELENFIDKPFNWDVIRRACKKIYVFQSDNDPYIPVWIGKEIAKKLGAELVIEHNGDHLNAPDGFLEYPNLLKKIMDL